MVRAVLGPQRAVSTPFSICRLSLNLALVAPTQIAEISVSSAPQLVGQPFDEQLSDVTVRMLLPEMPAGPGGPGGPAMPGSPLAPDFTRTVVAAGQRDRCSKKWQSMS